MIVQKVYAYIMQDDEIVVFEQPTAPQAGVQVPGGSAEPGESIEAAALREAFEETGLQGLAIAHYLGSHERDMRDHGVGDIHERHFFCLTCAERIPRRWQHTEHFRSDGVDEPILLELYLTRLASLPPLSGERGVFVEQLKARLGVRPADG